MQKRRQDLAHERYASLTAGFMVVQKKSLFEGSVVESWQSMLDQSQEFTETFLVPFEKVAQLESSAAEAGGETSPWIIAGKSFLVFQGFGWTPKKCFFSKRFPRPGGKPGTSFRLFSISMQSLRPLSNWATKAVDSRKIPSRKCADSEVPYRSSPPFDLSSFEPTSLCHPFNVPHPHVLSN